MLALFFLVAGGWYGFRSLGRAPENAARAVVVALPAPVRVVRQQLPAAVRLLRISYRAAAGELRRAFVSLPAWYSRRRDPPLPLVISPHGRGVPALSDCRSWGTLPGVGGFAVVCPQGQGAHLRLYSWGAPQQIADLARMPGVVRARLPWLRLRRRRIYAVGGSMGGQEVLLLLARHPRLLAGAIAFDAVTNFARQYRDFGRLRCNAACQEMAGQPLGRELQKFARSEIGGTPGNDRLAYLLRSPLHFSAQIAASGVPLELWWSTSDLIVTNQEHAQSGALFRAIRRLNPGAPVEAFIGAWIHSREQRPTSRLPFALAQLGLLPARYLHRTPRLHERHFIPRRLFIQPPTH